MPRSCPLLSGACSVTSHALGLWEFVCDLGPEMISCKDSKPSSGSFRSPGAQWVVVRGVLLVEDGGWLWGLLRSKSSGPRIRSKTGW